MDTFVARQAVILVGGKGTRLGEATRDTPKPMLPIEGDRRFLDYLLDQVARQGFTDIVMVAGHLGDQVAARFDGAAIREARVRVVREPEPRGTAGALLEVADKLDPAFLMMNGDAFVDCNLRAFERAAAALGSATIATLQVDDPRRYGTLRLDGARVAAFREKNPEAAGPGTISAGIYRLDRSIPGTIASLPASMETDVFPALASAWRLHCAPVSGWFLDIGRGETLAQARAELPARTTRPCGFLDRDGTLNVDKGYTHRVADLVWIDGARRAIRRLNDEGYLAIVCTNQAGVARGLYGEADVHAFHAAMRAELAREGAFVDAFYHCPFHVGAVDPRYRVDHPDRKPNPGMLLRAMRDWSIDRSRSFMIGDGAGDLAAARAAGVAGHLYDGGPLDRMVESILAAGP